MAQAIANQNKPKKPKGNGGGQNNNGGGGGSNNGGGGNQGGNNGGGNGGGGNQDQGGHGGGNPGYNLPQYLTDYLGRSQGDINNMASTQVDLALHPYLAEIDRSQQEAQQQYGSDVTRAKSIYGGLQNDLAPIQKQYSSAASDIQKNLSQALGQFANQLPTGGFGQENQAAAGAVGASGQGALGLLAANEAQQAAYNASANRQAGIEQADVQHNFLSDLQDALDVLRNRKLDVMQQAPEMTTARLDQLMQSQLEGNLGVQQFLLNAKAQKQSAQSNRALQDYLMKSIGASTSDQKNKNNQNQNNQKNKNKDKNKQKKNQNGSGNKNNGGGGNGGPQNQQGHAGHSGPQGPGGSGSGNNAGSSNQYPTALGILFSLKNGARTWNSYPGDQQKIALNFIQRFASQHPNAFGGKHPQASNKQLLNLLLQSGKGNNPGGKKP